MNVPVHDPRARVISLEPNGDVISCIPYADDVALNGVSIIVGRTSGTANDAEGVAVKMNGMLEGVWLDEIRLL